MRKEIERAIRGSNGYTVTDFGNVYKKNRLLKQTNDSEGRPRVYLRAKYNHRRVDWIVAIAFLGDPPAPVNIEIEHIDGSNENCSAENLRYIHV